MSFEQRTVFLELFIKEVIRNSYGKGFKVKINPEDFEEEYEKEIEKIRILSGENLQQTKEPKELKTEERFLQKKYPLLIPRQKTHTNIKKPAKVQGMFLPIQKTTKNETPLQIPLKKEQKTETTQEGFNSFQRLKPILSDPRVFELECPGPDKFILVKTTTKILNSGIRLNQSEIKNIIEYFSIETRIPLIGGLFRAVKDNLLMSAVFSEMAGSRFIIKKLSPSMLNQEKEKIKGNASQNKI